MPKLMHCAPRCCQSTPKVRAICATWPSSPAAANKIKAFIVAVSSVEGAENGRILRPHRWLLFHQEQGVEDDRFRKGNGQNRLHQNLRGRAGICVPPRPKRPCQSTPHPRLRPAPPNRHACFLPTQRSVLVLPYACTFLCFLTGTRGDHGHSRQNDSSISCSTTGACSSSC